MSNDYLTMLQGAAPAVPAEISAPKNEYMDMLQADADQRKQAMAGTLTTAVGANPDQYSAKRKVAGYLGYPVAAVEAMPKLTQQAQVQKVQEDTAAVPALQKKYQDADFAQLAHDDSGVLARIGHGLTEAAKYVVSAPDAADGGMLNGIVKAGRSLLSGAGPGVTGAVANAAAAPFGLADEILQSFDDAAAAITGTPRRQIVGTPGPEGFLRWIGAGQADLAKKVAGESPDAGFIEKSVMSGFQSAGQNLVALPVGLAQTGAVTAETAVLGLMGLITGGQSYAKGRDAGLSPVRASLYGLQDAGAEVITEKYMGLAGFLTRVKAGTSAARLALYEVFTEVPGEAAATTWQNFNEWVNVNPDKPVGDWIAEQPEALAQTIIATLVGGGTQIGAVKGLERLAGASGARENIAASVQAQADQLQRAMQTAAESKLRERDPEQFRAAVQAMAESQDGAPASVYVDAEVLNQLPPEVLNQLPQAVRDQLQDATVAGDVVNIPMGDALAVAPGTPLEQMLVEHGRIGDPMAPSQAEAKLAGDKAAEWLAGESAAVIQQANDSATMQESSDRVRQGLLDQLNTVGRFRAHVNEGYATWAAAFYTTMAGRMGITPEEMAARYPLRIVGATGASTGPTLEQGAGTPSGQTDEATGLPLNTDGTVTVYHHTSAENAAEIQRTGQLKSAGEPDLYFTTTAETNTGYGDTAVPFRVKPSRLALDDEFPDGRQDFRVEAPSKARRVRFLPDGSAELNQAAFHGTPHRGIEKFSTDAIGTGEGNQAFGWGLYFAGKRGVAEHYRTMLSPDGYTYDGALIKPTDSKHSAARDALTLGVDGAIDKYQALVEKWGARAQELNGKGPFAQLMKSANESLAWLKSIDPAKLKQESGRGQLYGVELPDDSAMLDFNKDWAGQSKEVKAILKAAGVYSRYQANLSDFATPMSTRNKAMRGENIYAFLAHELGSEKAASQYLDGLGIPGLKYKGGTIAGITNAGHNYVIFHGDHAQVTKTFYQGTARGTFNPANLELALNSNADLSTFFHETGHFFLEVMNDLASQTDAPAEIKADMDTLFKWFGVTAEDWASMPLDQQRPYHERFAESMEQYLLDGKAPSVELAPLFRKFRAWVLSVYKSLQSFVKGNQGATEIQLSDEVRAVFDRMLASEAEISQAEEVAGMMPDDEATAKAVETLTARSIRDLKWAVNARSKAIKALQAEAASLRREVRIDARREIMSQPVYRLWSFLSAKLTDADRFASPDAKSDPTTLDPSKDSLLVAIAKLGGIARDSAAQHLGVHADDFNHPSGVFGKPVFRKEGGLSADSMGAALEERGYLLPGEDGHYDLRELEELVAGEIRGDPQYSIAKQYFLESERGGEHIDVGALNAGRFDLANLRSLGADPEVVAKIEALRMTLKDGGIHPDILADSFGFADGLTMVKALADAFPPLAAVEGLTGQRMLEQHGDLVDQRAIEAAANQAVHNEARAKSLATELKTQNEMLNPRRDTGEVNAAGSKITVNALMEAAKLFAARVVSSTPVRDLKAKAHQHTAAERRAAKRWQEATTKGDTAAAVKAKQDQLLNNAAAKAAMDAMGEAKRILEFFKRVTKGNSETVVEKGRDADVVNAARAVLAAYGVGGASTKTALEYMDLVEKNDPAMYAALQPSVQGALNMAQPLAALTMEQLQGLHEEIQAMWHLAKRSRQMEVAGNLMDIDDAADELQARMQALGVPVVMPGESGALTPAETRSRWLQHAASLLRRVEQWAEGMDGKFGGPFLRLVFQPVKQAAENYRADRVTYRKAYQALVDAVAPSLKKGLIEAPELGAGGYTFGRGHNGIGHAELLHAILHTGNESNKRKLLLGRRWATENVDGTLDTSKWDAFLQRMHDTGVLGKVHYDFAQGVWDLLEQTKPLAQKAHRDVFGRYFAEVTADSFTNPFGTYRGGYVPAQADPRIVQDAALRDMARQENENMSFSFPGTNKGFTKGRVEYNRPLMLDLRTIGQHIDKVLLFSHMEPAVRDVNKLLTQRGVSQSLGKIDPTVYAGMLTPWLNRSARQIVETPIVGDGGISRVLSAARGRAGMALMFANLSNTVQQLTGFAGAFAKLKSDGLNSTMLRSAAQMIANPKRLAESVATLSPFMRDRMDNEIGAINAAMDAILLDPSIYEKAQAWTSKHAYFLQSAFDNTMGPIIWNSAYNGALAKGIAQVDAVHYADGVIRQTQGSTLPEDVSRIETGPAYARMFTQFIGYFNMMANTNATALKQIASETGLKKGAGKALMVVTMGMLVPIWVAEAIAVAFRGGPDDPEGDGYLDDWLAAVFGMGTIKGTLAMVPFVGQLANAGINRLNTNPADDRVSVSPAVSILEAAVGAPVSVYKAIHDEGNKVRAVRDVASAVSIATGLPAMAVARPLGYLAGVQQGTISPTSTADMARGLATGAASPASKNK